MIEWLLFVAICLLIAGRLREHFQDPDFPVSRPAKTPIWLSKIDAQAPIGGDDDLYISVLQAFYDKVYKPASVRPTDKDVDAFLRGPDANRPGLDINVLRKIIGNSFGVERTVTAVEREQKQVAFKVTEAIQPKDGRDQVYNRTEALYTPSDTRIGELPEGIYEDIPQQDEPRRPGFFDNKSTSWTDAAFYSVCEGGACEQNVL
jgi:hypothetical protein